MISVSMAILESDSIKKASTFLTLVTARSLPVIPSLIINKDITCLLFRL